MAVWNVTPTYWASEWNNWLADHRRDGTYGRIALHLETINTIAPQWQIIHATNERLEVTVEADVGTQLHHALNRVARLVRDMRDVRMAMPQFCLVITRERMHLTVRGEDRAPLELKIDAADYDVLAAVLDETVHLARVRRDFHDGGET